MLLTPLLQTTVQLDLAGAAEAQELSGSATNFPDLITGLLSAVMVVGALFVLFFFMWAAIEWITAGGDAGKIEKARAKITQSIIGLIVLSTTLALFFMLQQFLGLEILRSSRSSGRSGGSTSNTLNNDVNSNDASNSDLIDSLLEGLNGSETDSTSNVDDSIEIRQETLEEGLIQDTLENFPGFTINEELVNDAIRRALDENPNGNRQSVVNAARHEERLRQAQEYLANQEKQ